ncbi:hypothetical protein BDV12DRAFT_38616 [Aspergillus spectabilis]
MSPVEGNAWAQMKAKEREKQLSDPDREPPPKPTITRNFSGLDYDAELALPMPKPRHVRPEDMPPSPTKPDALPKPNVTKKRSTTEPSLPTGRRTKSEASEKKKSKVATLRSKFSLKDLGKEFRKELPPLSSIPKLGGGSGNETKRASSDGESQSKSPQTFNEARLYVPKTRTGDVLPNSAPPHTCEFRESASSEKHSEDSILSCPFMHTPTKSSYDGSTEATLLDGSSPAVRTGECNNTGQPELIQVEPRVMSMKTENTETAVPATLQTPPPPAPLSIDAAAYSPSVYDTPKKATAKASESSLFQKKESQQAKHPLIVSSSSYKGKDRAELTESPLFMAPRTPSPPPAVPARSRARDAQREHQDHIVFDGGQYLAGVTSHGGNLENNNNWTADQILRQVESTCDLARLINTRTAAQADFVKELPGLLMDARIQINVVQQETHQTEERIKAFVQQEIAKLKTELSELILASVASTQPPQTYDWKPSGAYIPNHDGQGGFKPARDGEKRAQHQSKRKSKQFSVRRDESVVKNKADNKKPAADLTQEIKPGLVSQAEHATEKQTEKIPGESVATPTAAFRTPNPHTDDAATPVSAKRSVQENPGEESLGSPKSKAAKLRISSPRTISDPQAALEGMQKNSLENNRMPALQRESDSKPRSDISNEDVKTPKKKGALFSFRRKGDGDNQSGNRFLRTPRRTKEGKPAGSQEGQSPRLAISTPTKAQAGILTSPDTSSTSTAVALSGAQITRCDSPSSIHPALRNPQQRQAMLERERRLAALNRHIQSQAHSQAQVQAQGHIHPLRVSHSHQNFHTGSASPAPSFISYDAPNPRYASGLSMATSSSASSFRGLTHYPPSMHYHQPSSSSLPPRGQLQGQAQPHFHATHSIHPYPPLPDPGFSAGHGHGHGPANIPGQFDGGEWTGNGTENETGYSVGNCF